MFTPTWGVPEKRTLLWHRVEMLGEMDAAARHHAWWELSRALSHISEELASYENLSSWSGPASVERAWQAQHLRSQTEYLRHYSNLQEYGA